MAQLAGKVAVVTGGGRGIGRAHALALSRAGAAVVVNDVGREGNGDGEASLGPADEVVQDIVAAGGRAIADGTDISDWDAVGGLVDRALDAFGGLDIVLNNASISRLGAIDAISREDWDRTVATNLTGTAALSHWSAKYWRAQGPAAHRRIVNTTSGVGLHPVPNNPTYVAAKAGIAGLTISCALALAELGVRVNAIAPVARSRNNKRVSGVAPVGGGFDEMSPDHAALLATYLASPACRFTGRVFGVVGDGITQFDGWTVAHAVDNDGQDWTVDGLASALAAWPQQQDGQGHSIGGVVPRPTPDPAALEALAAVEEAPAPVAVN